MVNPISTLFVRVTDLDRSVKFYSDIFSISFQRNAPTTAMGRLGDSFIVLQAHIEPEIKSAILFAVDNLDTITEAIKQQGGNIQNSRYSGAFGEAVMLTDPDGLPLEFITPSPELNEF